jgi:hypothetical protein
MSNLRARLQMLNTINAKNPMLTNSTTTATPSAPAFAQATTVPGTKRGLLERPGCRVYYEITGSGPPLTVIVISL